MNCKITWTTSFCFPGERAETKGDWRGHLFAQFPQPPTILSVIDQSMRTSTGQKCQPQMRIERFDSIRNRSCVASLKI